MRKYNEAIELSKIIAPKLKGTSYVLLMAFDSKNGPSKDYVPFPRDHMPCWGGDMRKYKSTHGDKCTQPVDKKPTDLYQPFPETGFPVAVVLNLKIEATFFDDIMSYTPYGTAFKDVIVEWNKDFISISSQCGKKFPVDPSAIVSFIFFMRRFGDSTKKTLELYSKVREEVGPKYAMLTFATKNLSQAVGESDNLVSLAETIGYHFANIDPVGFIQGKFRDLSGGFYGDGFDYNRVDIAYFLASSVPSPISFSSFNKELSKEYPMDNMTYKFPLGIIQYAKKLKAYVEPFVNSEISSGVAA